MNILFKGVCHGQIKTQNQFDYDGGALPFCHNIWCWCLHTHKLDCDLCRNASGGREYKRRLAGGEF